jgi:hypothetical protein
MLKVFISYSHADEEWRKILASHLRPLERAGLIQVWHDRKLQGGDDFATVIDGHIDDADLMLPLVSPDFINSEYCYGIELNRARERHAKGELRIMPIIVRACRWQILDTLNGLLAAPTDGKAVASWTDKDEAMDDVARMISDLAAKPAKPPAVTPPPTPNKSPPVRAPETKTRALGVALSSKPTDLDRDRFLRAAFTHIKDTFGTSVETLPNDQGVEGELVSLDANRFTATIYRHGKKVAGCTIYLGGSWGRGVSYLGNDSGETNSANETLSLEESESGLFLKSLFSMGRSDAPLTIEAAAEYLWSKFTEPLSRDRR